MASLTAVVQELGEQTLYGLWASANDRTVPADIGALSKRYWAACAAGDGALPFYVLSRNYNELSGDFELFTGGTAADSRLEKLILPAGEYAQMEVRPKLGRIWGTAIGEAKRYFYTKWLPASSYQGLNLEYELHTEKSVGKHPSIDLIFAVRKKDKNE